MIEINEVSKSYSKGTVRAVNGLNLNVEPGQIFGFLGPNGAGKSTTIKMLTGLLNPDSGSLQLCGTDIVRNPIEAKKLIGYVPDEPVFYDKMSGMAFLKFIADIYDCGESQRRTALATAAEFELQDKLPELISSYSHGMKQKLSITAALMHEPEVFILDEPISGLDPQSAFVLKSKMRELCDKGKTVFFSTHVMEVAERICDRVGIISHGKIRALGRMDEIKAGAQSGDTLEKIFLELTNENSSTD